MPSETLATAQRLAEEAAQAIREGNPQQAAWRLADALGLLALSGEVGNVAERAGIGEFTGRGFRLEANEDGKAEFVRSMLEVVPVTTNASAGSAYDHEALAVECPHCGAARNRLCKSAGIDFHPPHAARLRNSKVLGNAPKLRAVPDEARR